MKPLAPQTPDVGRIAAGASAETGLGHSSAASAVPAERPFEHLPQNLVERAIEHLRDSDFGALALTSRHMHGITSDPSVHAAALARSALNAPTFPQRLSAARHLALRPPMAFVAPSGGARPAAAEVPMAGEPQPRVGQGLGVADALGPLAEVALRGSSAVAEAAVYGLVELAEQAVDGPDTGRAVAALREVALAARSARARHAAVRCLLMGGPDESAAVESATVLPALVALGQMAPVFEAAVDTPECLLDLMGGRGVAVAEARLHRLCVRAGIDRERALMGREGLLRPQPQVAAFRNLLDLAVVPRGFDAAAVRAALRAAIAGSGPIPERVRVCGMFIRSGDFEAGIAGLVEVSRTPHLGVGADDGFGAVLGATRALARLVPAHAAARAGLLAVLWEAPLREARLAAAVALGERPDPGALADLRALALRAGAGRLRPPQAAAATALAQWAVIAPSMEGLTEVLAEVTYHAAEPEACLIACSGLRLLPGAVLPAPSPFQAIAADGDGDGQPTLHAQLLCLDTESEGVDRGGHLSRVAEVVGRARTPAAAAAAVAWLTVCSDRTASVHPLPLACVGPLAERALGPPCGHLALDARAAACLLASQWSSPAVGAAVAAVVRVAIETRSAAVLDVYRDTLRQVATTREYPTDTEIAVAAGLAATAAATPTDCRSAADLLRRCALSDDDGAATQAREALRSLAASAPSSEARLLASAALIGLPGA